MSKNTSIIPNQQNKRCILEITNKSKISISRLDNSLYRGMSLVDV